MVFEKINNFWILKDSNEIESVIFFNGVECLFSIQNNCGGLDYKI